MTHHTNSNSSTQSISRSGYIAAVALTSGRVLGAYRHNATSETFDLICVDDDINDGMPDPVAITVADIPMIVRLLEDAASVMNGGE